MNVYIWATYDRDVGLTALGLSLCLNLAVLTWKLATWADHEIARRNGEQ